MTLNGQLTGRLHPLQDPALEEARGKIQQLHNQLNQAEYSQVDEIIYQLRGWEARFDRLLRERRKEKCSL